MDLTINQNFVASITFDISIITDLYSSIYISNRIIIITLNIIIITLNIIIIILNIF